MRKIEEFNIVCEGREKELLATDKLFSYAVIMAINYQMDEFEFDFGKELTPNMMFINLRPVYAGTPAEDCLLLIIDKENPRNCMIDSIKQWEFVLNEEP